MKDRLEDIEEAKRLKSNLEEFLSRERVMQFAKWAIESKYDIVDAMIYLYDNVRLHYRATETMLFISEYMEHYKMLQDYRRQQSALP